MAGSGSSSGGLLLLVAVLVLSAAGASLERLLEVLQGVPGASQPQRWPRHAPPRYMLDLYRSVAAPDGLTFSPTPHRANVVRCYTDRESRHRSHFYFNVSSDKTDKLLEAEFHVFKMKPRTKDRRRANALKSQLLELKVYQVLAPTKTRKKRRKKLLETRRISVHSTGWEIFSIKEAVSAWIKDNDSNLGLTLSIRTLENEPVPKGLIRFARGSRSDRQPLLVLFIDDSRKTSGSTVISADGGYYSYSERNKTSPSFDLTRTKRGDGHGMASNPSRNNGSCAKHDLYIDFERIGWAAWIISPKGYNAYQCEGDCSFPLGQNQRPTNHATVQSIAHELGLTKAVKLPCCVPDRLVSISLLYFDEYGNVILKQYDDMVAAGCGCH